MLSESSDKSSENPKVIIKKIKKKRQSPPPLSSQDEKSHKKKSSKPSIFLVEDILAKEKFQGKWKYLVKWKGFPKEQATWEPFKNLENAKVMIKNFELKQKIKANKEKNKKKLKEMTEEAEKLKAHKKADNSSFFQSFEVGSNVSENEINIMGNSQMMFKSNALLSIDNEKEGDFRLGDKPKKILFAKRTRNGILFAVDWETRKNGIYPEISFYDNSQMKNYAPQVLIDYYEEHLKMREDKDKDNNGTQLSQGKKENDQ